MTALTAVVALVTNTRSVVRAPTKRAKAERVGINRSSKRRQRNCTGSASISRRSSCWSSRSARGQAPKEPWFKNMVPGASAQQRRNLDAAGRVSFERCTRQRYKILPRVGRDVSHIEAAEGPASRNAGFIRQGEMSHGPLPDKSGVPVVVSRGALEAARQHILLFISVVFCNMAVLPCPLLQKGHPQSPPGLRNSRRRCGA